MQTAMNKSTLDVSSQFSPEIRLEPVAPEKRIAYVGVRDASGEFLDLKDDVIARMQNQGIQITDDPEKANFMLIANVVDFGKQLKEHAQMLYLKNFLKIWMICKNLWKRKRERRASRYFRIYRRSCEYFHSGCILFSSCGY